MVPITDVILEEYKELYVKETGLGVDSDEMLKKTLKSAYQYIIDKSDDFDIEKDETGKQLVFDRARYVRNNASELFYQNFLPDLNSFGFKLAMERDYSAAQEGS